MQYTELKQSIIDLVNRKDMTTAQVDRYVKMALNRINRQLRASFMEVDATLTIGSASDAPIPADYLATVSIHDDDTSTTNDPYVYKNWFDFKTVDASDSTPIYTRRGNKFIFKPALAAGTVIEITYFARIADPTGDTYEPELFKLAPDLVIYGAAVHGAAAFQDDRLQMFSDAYNGLLAEVTDHYASSYMSEGPLSIQPPTDVEF